MEKTSPQTAGPIKSTKLRRALTLTALRIASRTRYRIPYVGARIAPTLMVKVRQGEHLEEAANTQYIRSHTAVPVPKVYCAFYRNGRTYTVMTWVRGQTLWTWWQTASEVHKEDMRTQIKEIMMGLRQTANPCPGEVRGLVGGHIYDRRYTAEKSSDAEESENFGPFDSVYEFHLWLRNGFTNAALENEEKTKVNEDLKRMCEMQDRQEYKTVLTHGDLSGSNIIVKDDKVAGIIDWESTGWLPDYWEFTSAWHVNAYDEFWQPEVENILGRQDYEVELEADKIRRQYFQGV